MPPTTPGFLSMDIFSSGSGMVTGLDLALGASSGAGAINRASTSARSSLNVRVGGFSFTGSLSG